MKFNPISATIGVAMALLLAYLCYAISSADTALLILLTLGSFIANAATLVPAFAVSVPEYPRTTALLKTVASVFSVIIIGANIVISFLDFSAPFYIIITGLLLLVFILVYYSVYRAKQ